MVASGPEGRPGDGRAGDAVLLSFRLGGTDGVSVEAEKWAWALRQLGFTVRRVAGELPGLPWAGDVSLPWLARTAAVTGRVDDAGLAAALRGAALVVAENICSLPLNLPASRCAGRVLEAPGPRVVLHHHDLAWQRDQFRRLEGIPPDLPGALHVTINDQSQRELAARGISAVTIRNRFRTESAGDRAAARAAFGLAPDDVVLLQPTRAIPRKRIPLAVDFAAAVQAALADRRVVLWVTGPAEDGYDDEFREIIAGAPVRVVTGRTDDVDDAYAACDAVVLASSWEGFGNPVIEAALAAKPLAVADYPALREIRSLGFDFVSLDEPGRLAAALRHPDLVGLEANRRLAVDNFALDALPGLLQQAFRSVGWPEFPGPARPGPTA